MGKETKRMIELGVIEQICLAHYRAGGRPHDWRKVREQLIRDFPDQSSKTLQELIAFAQKCSAAGRECQRCYERGDEYTRAIPCHRRGK